MSHTTKTNGSSLHIIHNGDFSGELEFCTGKQTVTVDGPDFLALCEAVASQIVMDKIAAVLDAGE